MAIWTCHAQSGGAGSGHPTGLGELRSGLIVRSSDAVVAVGGSWGTISEVALAVRTGKPVVALHSWRVVGADPGTEAGVTGSDGGPGAGPAVAADVEEVLALLDKALPGGGGP